MTDKKTEALKLSLEALKQIDEAMPFPVAKFAQAAIREALAEQAGKDKEQAKTDAFIKQLDQALADSALDRMAENARELGLDYELPCKTGSQCTSKCQQCEQPAQGETK